MQNNHISHIERSPQTRNCNGIRFYEWAFIIIKNSARLCRLPSTGKASVPLSDWLCDCAPCAVSDLRHAATSASHGMARPRQQQQHQQQQEERERHKDEDDRECQHEHEACQPDVAYERGVPLLHWLHFALNSCWFGTLLGHRLAKWAQSRVQGSAVYSLRQRPVGERTLSPNAQKHTQLRARS